MNKPDKSQTKKKPSPRKPRDAAPSPHVNPVTVPFSAKPRGEPPEISEWAQPLVWTDRMLTTLREGVRGGKWHTLIDKVYSLENLFFAASIPQSGC